MNNEEYIEEYIEEECQKRLTDLGLFHATEYHHRLFRELKVIKDKGFVDYFLIYADIVEQARSEGIMVGPARGSAGGSLVSYLLNITQVDPIKYGLLFERFLDPSRLEFPDIDVDFQKSRREEVVEYVKEKYGEEKVSNIINFSRFRARNTTKDVARLFNVSFKEVNKITKLMDKDMSLDDAMQVPEVKKFYDKYPDLKEMAFSLEGAIRGFSKHAAGIVVTPTPLYDYVGIEKVKNTICSSFDKRGVEDLGLLKLDVLGLRTLDVIAAALNMIDEDIELPIEFDDPKVYELFQRGDTMGTFQFDTQLLSGIAREIGIDDFEKLCAVTAIARPGPLNSGQAEEYIKRVKNG